MNLDRKTVGQIFLGVLVALILSFYVTGWVYLGKLVFHKRNRRGVLSKKLTGLQHFLVRAVSVINGILSVAGAFYIYGLIKKK